MLLLDEKSLSHSPTEVSLSKIRKLQLSDDGFESPNFSSWKIPNEGFSQLLPLSSFESKVFRMVSVQKKVFASLSRQQLRGLLSLLELGTRS